MSLASRTSLIAFSLFAAGCYETAGLEADTGGISADEEQGSSNVGPLDAPRGRLELDGFTVYWKQTSEWDGGACIEVRLRNTECPVYNWEAALLLDQNLDNWVDEGGAYFWPEDNLVLVEPDGNSSLGLNDSAVFFFCAEPAVQVIDFDLRSLANDCGDSSSSSGSGSSGSGSSGSGSSGSGSSGSSGEMPPVWDQDMRLNTAYVYRRSDGLQCYDVSWTNTDSADASFSSVTLFMHEDVTVAELNDDDSSVRLSHVDNTITLDLGGAQTFPAGSTSGSQQVCWTPDEGVKDVSFNP